MHHSDVLEQIKHICHEMRQPLCYSKMTLDLAEFNSFGEDEINLLKGAIEKLSSQLDKIRAVIDTVNYEHESINTATTLEPL